MKPTVLRYHEFSPTGIQTIWTRAGEGQEVIRMEPKWALFTDCVTICHVSRHRLLSVASVFLECCISAAGIRLVD